MTQEPKDGDTVYRFNLSVDLEVVVHRFVYHHDTARELVPGMEGDFYAKAPNYTREWACYTLSRGSWRLNGRTDTDVVLGKPQDGWFTTYGDARAAAAKLLAQRIERLKNDLTRAKNQLTNVINRDWTPPP